MPLQITLKNVRHYPSMSQETACFEAVVYINGKKAGYVANRGHGGSHEMDSSVREPLAAYARTLPAETYEMDGKSFTLPQCADSLIDDALNVILRQKEEMRFERIARKDLSTRVMFVREGKLLQTKKLPAAAVSDAVKHYVAQGETVLNALPFAEAFAMWKQYVVK